MFKVGDRVKAVEYLSNDLIRGTCGTVKTLDETYSTMLYNVEFDGREYLWACYEHQLEDIKAVSNEKRQLINSVAVRLFTESHNPLVGEDMKNEFTASSMSAKCIASAKTLADALENEGLI